MLKGSVKNNIIKTISTDKEDQDSFHNSDDDGVDPLNFASENNSERRGKPATGIKIENSINNYLQERGKVVNLVKEL